MGEVGVAVGVALFSNLNKANHWDQHNEIPQPASEQVRSFLSENDCCHSDGEHEYNRENHLPNWQRVIWMRIENGKIRRPKYFPDINQVTHERVLHAPEERQRRNRASSAFLQDKGNNTRARCEDQQGDLFEKQTSYCAHLIAGPGAFGFPVCWKALFKPT